MESLFCHKVFEKGDTIAAIATPPGDGGVGIIRISGKNAIEIGNNLFSGNVKAFESHRAYFGKIGNIDEGLLLVMIGPKSYTGEDTVEIHCHGGSLITKNVLQSALDNGARAAMPGEFTRRAFENGKIDLTKAEAVQQLIASKGEMALASAKNQLDGRLHSIISKLQNELTHVAAILEAWVDFPEEGLEFASKSDLLTMLHSHSETLTKLADTFFDGQKLHTDLTLVLLGAPNSGKSSLLNALTNRNRAIVTAIPGTTRDVIEEEVHIGDMNYRLSDTAGIRESSDVIEQEGIKRSHAAAKNADLILYVLDATKEKALPEMQQTKTIFIWNKIDLTHNEMPSAEHIVPISAKCGDGLELLKEEINKVIWKRGAPSKDEVLITQKRHYEALIEAQSHLNQMIEGLKGDISPEFLTSDMREALLSLGTIIGTNITEDLLSSIFSKFCVGK